MIQFVEGMHGFKPLNPSVNATCIAKELSIIINGSSSQKQVLESDLSEASSQKQVLKSKFSKASSQKQALESKFSKASSQKQVLESKFSKASSRKQVLESEFLKASSRKQDPWNYGSNHLDLVVATTSCCKRQLSRVVAI
jgi:hypothetical protein